MIQEIKRTGGLRAKTVRSLPKLRVLPRPAGRTNISHSPIGDIESHNIGDLRDKDGAEIQEEPRLKKGTAPAIMALHLFETGFWDDTREFVLTNCSTEQQSEFGLRFLNAGLRHHAKALFTEAKDHDGLRMTGKSYMVSGYFNQAMECYGLAKAEPELDDLHRCEEELRRSNTLRSRVSTEHLDMVGRLAGMIKHAESQL
jgi:hypothetical protein